MVHIPTYQERLAEMHAEGAVCPATRFNRTQRAREAQSVLRRLRENEDAIESLLCAY